MTSRSVFIVPTYSLFCSFPVCPSYFNLHCIVLNYLPSLANTSINPVLWISYWLSTERNLCLLHTEWYCEIDFEHVNSKRGVRQDALQFKKKSNLLLRGDFWEGILFGPPGRPLRSLVFNHIYWLQGISRRIFTCFFLRKLKCDRLFT